MVLKTASGAPTFSGTPLSMPVLSAHILQRFYQTTIFSSISTTEYTGELERQGDTIIFQREPDFRVRDGGGINSNIRHDSGEFSAVSFRVGRSMYFSLAVDPLMASRTQGWAQLEAALINRGSQKMNEYIDQTVLSELPAYIPAGNRGTTAGIITKQWNLGALGSALTISKTTVLEVLTRVRGVMAERNVDVDVEPIYMIVPPSFDVVLMNSDLKSYMFTGQGTTYATGKPFANIVGIQLLKTNRCPRVWDVVAGKWVYQLVFGTKRATAFCAMTEQSRKIDSTPDNWLYYIQQRACWDFFPLYPELLGLIVADVQV